VHSLGLSQRPHHPTGNISVHPRQNSNLEPSEEDQRTYGNVKIKPVSSETLRLRTSLRTMMGWVLVANQVHHSSGTVLSCQCSPRVVVEGNSVFDAIAAKDAAFRLTSGWQHFRSDIFNYWFSTFPVRCPKIGFLVRRCEFSLGVHSSLCCHSELSFRKV
jgi:hypothetical protein